MEGNNMRITLGTKEIRKPRFHKLILPGHEGLGFQEEASTDGYRLCVLHRLTFGMNGITTLIQDDVNQMRSEIKFSSSHQFNFEGGS